MVVSVNVSLLCQFPVAPPFYFSDSPPTKKSRVFVVLVLLQLPNRRHHILSLLLDRRSWKKTIHQSSVFSISLNLKSHNWVDFGLQILLAVNNNLERDLQFETDSDAETSSTMANGTCRFNLDGIADVLLALDRIEQNEELAYEVITN
ncbi:hypothetical protein L1887_23471 [Cichorium endivia]|nr:hypothetical protein L1887_23471 [Cichorium endivia]